MARKYDEEGVRAAEAAAEGLFTQLFLISY